MRIHVYSQELTDEIAVVQKTAEGRVYRGLRLFLRSPECLHHTGTDDDRSAVTLWVAEDGRTFDRFRLAEVLEKAAALLRKE